jgi:hypothetical protein
MSGRRGGPDALPFGWTAVDVETVARRAAWWSRWSVPAFSERVDVARFAVVDHLFTCEGHGPGCDLLRVGVRAIDRHVARDESFYGVVLRRAGERGTPMLRFRRYWTPPPPRSMEEGVVEVLALRQIWPRLAEVDRRAILALATHGDVDRAAAALGMTQGSFRTRIFQARRSFLRLWHEHEPPSGLWSRDTPLTHPRGHRTNSIGSTLRRRHRRRAAGRLVHDEAPAAGRKHTTLPERGVGDVAQPASVLGGDRAPLAGRVSPSAEAIRG